MRLDAVGHDGRRDPVAEDDIDGRRAVPERDRDILQVRVVEAAA